MTTSATAAAAAKVAKPKKAKAVSHAKQGQAPLPLPVVSTGAEFGTLAPSSIIIREQVRTEFDEESLRELASDIADRGILQPLTVRKIEDGFVLVAGERRLRAAIMANLEAVPVLVSTMSEEEHHAAQLAENIQREDLSTLETARAIRKLYDLGNSVTEIADMVHKSKGWVSKRLAASHPDLAWQAAQLLEKGISEDLELVLAVDQLAKLDYWEAQTMARKIEAGNAGRETVREQLAIAREKEAARQAQREAMQAEYDSPEYKARIEAEQKERDARFKAQQEEARRQMHIDPSRLMARFWDWIGEDHCLGGSAFCQPERLDRAQCDSLTAAVDQWYAAGQGMQVHELAMRLLEENHAMHHNDTWNAKHPEPWQLAAMSYGVSMNGKMASLDEFLDWYAGIVRSEQAKYRESDK